MSKLFFKPDPFVDKETGQLIVLQDLEIKSYETDWDGRVGFYFDNDNDIDIWDGGLGINELQKSLEEEYRNSERFKEFILTKRRQEEGDVCSKCNIGILDNDGYFCAHCYLKKQTY